MTLGKKTMWVGGWALALAPGRHAASQAGGQKRSSRTSRASRTLPLPQTLPEPGEYDYAGGVGIAVGSDAGGHGSDRERRRRRHSAAPRHRLPRLGLPNWDDADQGAPTTG